MFRVRKLKGSGLWNVKSFFLAEGNLSSGLPEFAAASAFNSSARFSANLRASLSFHTRRTSAWMPGSSHFGM